MKIKPEQAPRVALASGLLIRTLGGTWRYRFSGTPLQTLGHDVIFAFRHGDMLIGAHAFRHRDIAVMISQHRDGEVIAQICQRLGFRTVRGSTTRGGARAIREFLRGQLDVGWAVTPDGPRGPRGSFAPGVIQLAALSGRPIVPLGIVARHTRRMRSWDRFSVPLPFSRVAVHAGAPVAIPRRFDRAHGGLDAWSTQTQHAVDEAYRDACDTLGLDRHAEDP